MPTLTVTGLRALVVSAALAVAAPAGAIETLVDSDSSPDILRSLKSGQGLPNPILEDVSALPHYVGAVNAAGAVRERSFTLTLPDTGQTLALENPAAFMETPEPTVRTWHLPFLPAADGGALQGFIRLHNPTGEAAEIEIFGYDDAGRRSGPLATTLEPRAARSYNAYHLEGRQAHRALNGALHDGQGHWRLLVRSTTAIEARAYTRTNHAGFASQVHRRAALVAHSEPKAYRAPFLNPASNLGSRGYLRISNPSARPNTVTLHAWDNLAQPAEGPITVDVPAQATVSLSAQALEHGAPEAFDGRFGDGTGKWRVVVESADTRPLLVLALVATRNGAVHNVSR